ncbi:MAG: DUF4136 domain-containing protein [Polymorphobacter sp.]
MKITVLAAVAALALGSAALAGPKASAAADSTVNLAQYQSFGWAAPLGTDQNGYQSVLSQNLKASTQRQLEARGLRYDETNPQLLVNFNARLDDKMKVSSTPTMTMGVGMGRGYYGYRGGMYGTWPLYQDQTTVSQYKEGTLNIDIVDQSRKQLVWEAVVTDSFTEKKRDKLQETVEKYVLAAFKKYPVKVPKP